MALTIAVCNRRGGCGKSVTTLALGTGLQRKGYSVLMIDIDSQYSLTRDMNAAAGRYSTMDVLTGKASAQEAIVRTPQGDLIPATADLAGADTIIAGKGKQYRLKEALKPLGYDFCLIDTSPNLDTTTTNALTAANGVIIPVQPEAHSIDGIFLLNDSIEAIRQFSNPGLMIYGILITRFTARSIISRDMRANLQDVANQLGTTLYNTPIRECVAVKEAQAMHINILDYSPRSNASRDYEAFIDEFLQERK